MPYTMFTMNLMNIAFAETRPARTHKTRMMLIATVACMTVGVLQSHAQQGDAAPQPSDNAEKTYGEILNTTPDGMMDVGIDETKLDNQLPLDTKLVDSNGTTVRLGKYFDGERPVLLVFVYFNCPGICSILLDELVMTLRDMEWTAGGEFQIVTISMDPNDTPTSARLFQQKYVKQYERPSARHGWHFLVSPDNSMKQVANAAGYMFKPVEGTSDFSHPGEMIICTPDGRVSRYIAGIPEDPKQQPKTMKFSLLEAGDGKVGTWVDRFVLTCYHFDPDLGAYTLAANRLVTIFCILTALVLAMFLVPVWVRDSLRKKTCEQGSAAADA